MQNNDFTFDLRLTSKQNYLRFSQVVFLFALPVGGARTSYSAFCILTSAFAKSQSITPYTAKKITLRRLGARSVEKMELLQDQCFCQPGLWREASSSMTCSMRSPLDVSSTMRW